MFIVIVGLATTYTITTFGPKLSLQNKIKAIKAKVKELMLAQNNQIIPVYYMSVCMRLSIVIVGRHLFFCDQYINKIKSALHT
jgi:hypothetical protein